MKILLLLIFSLTAFTSTCLSQDNNHKKTYFPVWSFHAKNINIHSLSLGLGTGRMGIRNTNTNGVKLELVGLGILSPLSSQSPLTSVDSAMEKNKVSELINGLSLSVTGTFCNCKTNGISIGAVGQYNYIMNGFSASLLNYTYKQNGIQVGFINESTVATGVQIGIVNLAENIKGIQIGIWNINQRRRFLLSIGVLAKERTNTRVKPFNT